MMVRPMTSIRFLASVRSVAEAQIAARHGADIVDCKDPDHGALGALDPETIARIRAVVPRQIPVSATVGDDAITAPDLLDRVCNVAKTGVDFVKIGFDGTVPWQAALTALETARLDPCRLVAVVLADRKPNVALIEAVARANFAGILLDTADKAAGALPDVIAHNQIKDFIEKARAEGLFVGLAGALRASHVDELALHKPDILGFRSALCHDGGRRNGIDPNAVRRLRQAMTATARLHATAQTTSKVCTL